LSFYKKPLVEAPGFNPAEAAEIYAGFSRGRPGLKPTSRVAFIAGLEPGASTPRNGLTDGRLFLWLLVAGNGHGKLL
jgi:hypothetical protein